MLQDSNQEDYYRTRVSCKRNRTAGGAVLTFFMVEQGLLPEMPWLSKLDFWHPVDLVRFKHSHISDLLGEPQLWFDDLQTIRRP